MWGGNVLSRPKKLLVLTRKCPSNVLNPKNNGERRYLRSFFPVYSVQQANFTTVIVTIFAIQMYNKILK